MSPEEQAQLRIALGRRVETMFPSWSGARIHAAASALAGCGAYEVVFDGLRATGVQAAMQAAWKACPEFVDGFAKGSTQASSPAERTLAALAARGLELDPDVNGGEDFEVEMGQDGRYRIKDFTPPGAA